MQVNLISLSIEMAFYGIVKHFLATHEGIMIKFIQSNCLLR